MSETTPFGVVCVRVGDALFGAPVMQVQDVVSGGRLSRVPLAPPEVAGAMNLRGRIVTAIDMRRRLGLPPREGPGLSVTVETGADFYALDVDDVGDVLWLTEPMEPVPVTLSEGWRSLLRGLFRLEDELLLVLDIDAVLDLGRTAPAAPPPNPALAA